jgi:hypothetical protein
MTGTGTGQRTGTAAASAAGAVAGTSTAAATMPAATGSGTGTGTGTETETGRVIGSRRSATGNASTGMQQLAGLLADLWHIPCWQHCGLHQLLCRAGGVPPHINSTHAVMHAVMQHAQ